MDRRKFLGVTAGISGGLAVSGRVFAGERALTGAVSDATAFHGMRRYIRTSFGEIACIERGSGDAALFLHGFPLNSFQWRGALELLSPYRRCIAPDLLGMGFTRVADGQGVGPEDQVMMVMELLDKLNIGSVDVVANDSGGAVAQLILARHPHRVRTLLLTNGDTEIECPPSAMLPVIELAKKGAWVDQWLAPWHSDPKKARSADGIGGMCYSESMHPTDDAIDMYFGPILSTGRRSQLANAYAVALEKNALIGSEPALREAQVPVRIVWGRADSIFSIINPEYLDRIFSESRGIRWLDDGKLFWPEERPEVVAEEARVLWNA